MRGCIQARIPHKATEVMALGRQEVEGQHSQDYSDHDAGQTAELDSLGHLVIKVPLGQEVGLVGVL